ncbi:hypothetical protein RL72_00722 [Microbacterium azadirachtae]|uniref:Uncharacterized protein n=1 Tax=Microbacterium azadirachtae TaxID=582680 RepID=A0A0F0L1H7_9MICO|nr:hypothetical protein RL72_00722 [Microbacterium azadirachtae]SDM36948.1 hypothetical protein SAMN04488593_3368 [Microbacterium azadirachtae]SEG53403.1 hypothetical protein SAMN04488594_3353 [Microbacterium azadirachtae]SEG56284.1 hypothetical protein SAMN04488592_3363 [Microbacterium azadirachtae]SFR69050.1 hypothetical protein SAMN04488591_2970 [Microbacterium azadirachtae]
MGIRRRGRPGTSGEEFRAAPLYDGGILRFGL